MASRSNLGRIRPYPKGAYSATVEYVYFDMVTNDGSTYLYINTTASTGTAITDTAYWQCLAQKGEQGIAGHTINVKIFTAIPTAFDLADNEIAYVLENII
jgi:hypothetical protein